MNNKNSMFIRVLVPVVIVMLLQTLLISLVLFTNGTIKSLEDNAMENLRKNVENRSITLENMMVTNWSNLETFENEAAEIIEGYLLSNRLLLDDALADPVHQKNILYNMSGALLNTMRRNSVTGVYMYIIPDCYNYGERDMVLNGLYYRDLDPNSTPTDYSDISFVRGSVETARKSSIQLDSLWKETFSFSPKDEDVWRELSLPWQASLEHPDFSSVNLSYWNVPHFFNTGNVMDANECITYTRPLFYKDRLIGMIGTEMQSEQLKKYFPASDFDNYGKSGYMMVKYDAADMADGKTECDVYAITGSYINRMMSTTDSIILTSSNTNGIYTSEDNNIEDVHIAVKPLRLYNTNAPFSGDQWALASIGADSVLFEASGKVSSGILYSTSIALIIGIFLLAVLVRISTKPLILIANQIENGAPDDPVLISGANTYETSLLCSTINAMKDKRRHMEAELREERERYLFALESADDTFIEYDTEHDSFILYHFSTKNGNSELLSEITENFSVKMNGGEICHQDDIPGLSLFFTAHTTEPVEVRIKREFFAHINGVETDAGYYWFLFRASHINDSGGKVTKIIGVAREITRQKLDELAGIEASRRDLTTGLYNRDYGEQLVTSAISDELKKNQRFTLCVLRIEDFDKFEAYYGRVFGGAVLMRFCRELSCILGNDDIAVRVGNDEFLLFLSGAEKNEATTRLNAVRVIMAGLYTGENPDLILSVSAGAVLSSGFADYDELISMACSAVQYAGRAGKYLVWYDELVPELQNEWASYRDKPVSLSIDISKADIVAFTFDLFERTADIQSSVNILIDILGKMFGLNQIFICTFDADFYASHVSYQWNSGTRKPYHSNIEKISADELESFEQLLCENGTFFYKTQDIAGFGAGVRRLLCVRPGEQVSAFGCVMYENGVHMGRVLFKSEDTEKLWPDDETYRLYEIAKIISAHIAIEKSNSASRAKSEFLSRMSHEIRTPMTAIIGMTAIAQETATDPVRVKDCLAKIDFSAKHLLSLINDVLEMSRIESGKLTIQNEPFSLGEFAASLDLLMRPQLESKGLTFEIIGGATNTYVIGDEYRLRQVMVNLLGNAGKFTEAGGTVTLSVEEQEIADGIGDFRFSVKDNGIGIAKEDQPNIFNSFEQASDSTGARARSEGTGLGLAISSNIINAMGGEIELESDLGTGSEFYFTLKLKLTDIPENILAPEASDISYKDYFAGKRVLLVEDVEINLEIAEYVLGEAGLSVETARNGREAVDSFLASEPGYYDAIIMDIRMPVMDGLTATREIRKNTVHPDARKIPIIAMTANAFDEDMKKSIESGMDGHVAKPIDNKELYVLLRQLLDRET